MVSEGSSQTHVYELPLTRNDTFAKNVSSRKAPVSLPTSFLVYNALWFCRIRWAVIVVLVILGILGFYPEMFYHIGFKFRADWPFVLAGVLAAANMVFLWYARRLVQSATLRSVNRNIWSQIILDLVVVTVTVHFIGCLETYAPFLYLFHIVLACVFFSRPQSFLVAIIACVLYGLCVGTGFFFGFPPGIYLNVALKGQFKETALLNVGSVMAIWLIVWGLASRLSVMLQDQANELRETNRLLVEAQEEKTKNLLRTTHELKAPFAAIQLNTQLLLKGECGPLPPKPREIIGRIAERSRWLTFEIKEMLQLAGLRSAGQLSLNWAGINLAEELSWCINSVQVMAKEHDIMFEERLESSPAIVVEEHIRMFFTNLLYNSIIYSYKGGKVRVTCGPTSQERQLVIIEDHGIGIPADKLPKIFDDYYKTNEAVRHNKISTGLGLAIVRHVASTHGIRIRVESRVKSGTTFKLWFPPVRKQQGKMEKKGGGA